MAVRHETELYAPLKIFFEQQGYEIKGEVRSCDLVGVRGDEEPPLIVEMKKTFNLSLLLQGMERLKLSPAVYLAVERCREKKGSASQRWSELSHLCRRLGLGLVTVVFYKTKAPLVEVLAEPEAPAGPARSGGRRRDRLLYEFRERSGDYNTGGSARVKLVTAYREKALRVAAALEAAEREAALAAADGAAADGGGQGGAAGPARAPAAGALPKGVTPAELRRRSGVPAAAAILQNNYYGWFMRVVRGRYTLTAAGSAALLEYAAVSVSQSVADRRTAAEKSNM
ncbi:hypothetical protein SAMN04487895_105203 [Paenibacillus sophorae]|uniref:Uncharacterized protein n=1 Tax=Paenibacillus sophorae TaxID=1333845 RepID=A0A1H8MF73_9BACL|nr:DUF2161 family putative PD-(D/E)XK-type phosphodiesterase [Paenibacillus sophorae]QWU17785.1 hypothetical protein KP014_11990 [Paenibacillus sophorae]SEO15878.1 hypothetical protein SAMN04487895_105203 [Paenibacillus sophorae]